MKILKRFSPLLSVILIAALTLVSCGGSSGGGSSTSSAFKLQQLPAGQYESVYSTPIKIVDGKAEVKSVVTIPKTTSCPRASTGHPYGLAMWINLDPVSKTSNDKGLMQFGVSQYNCGPWELIYQLIPGQIRVIKDVSLSPGTDITLDLIYHQSGSYYEMLFMIGSGGPQTTDTVMVPSDEAPKLAEFGAEAPLANGDANQRIPSLLPVCSTIVFTGSQVNGTPINQLPLTHSPTARLKDYPPSAGNSIFSFDCIGR
jgi:hypothetical protein